jgi:hypothetical protein
MGVIKAIVTQRRSLLPWVWQPGRGQRNRPRVSSSIGDHHRGVINIGCSLWHCRCWPWSSSSLSVVIVVMNLGHGLWHIQHWPWSLLAVAIAVSISAVIVIVVGHGLWHFRRWSLSSLAVVIAILTVIVVVVVVGQGPVMGLAPLVMRQSLPLLLSLRCYHRVGGSLRAEQEVESWV